MATNNQNQKSEEPEPFLMPSPKQEKDVITIMGECKLNCVKLQ